MNKTRKQKAIYTFLASIVALMIAPVAAVGSSVATSTEIVIAGSGKLAAPVKQQVLQIATIVPPTIVPINPITIQSAENYNSSTIMLFDVSDSMREDDATGVSKLDAAKEAGGRILDIIQAENEADQGANVGILSFSDTAQVNSQLSTDVENARAALNSLYTQSGTGMANGLRLSIDQFANRRVGKPIIIMLSDGVPTTPLSGTTVYSETELRQQIFNLASEAGQKKICIYVVGLGVPATQSSITGYTSIDEDFLRQIVAHAGCGAYYNAQNATELANVYVSLRHESVGKVLFKQSGEIAQGQTLDVGKFDVPKDQNELLFTLNWPGSRLDPHLVDPAGKAVDPTYPGASFFNAKSLASIIIKNPLPGTWNVSATGIEVPHGKTTFNSVISVRKTLPSVLPPNEDLGSPLTVLIIVLAGVGLVVYISVTTGRRGRSVSTIQVGSVWLVQLSGHAQGTTFFLQDNYTIGRGRLSNLALNDRAVSRQHARIRYSNSHWYIQDLQSAGGTFVNGIKISAAPLKAGDRIRIGSSEFEFKE